MPWNCHACFTSISGNKTMSQVRAWKKDGLKKYEFWRDLGRHQESEAQACMSWAVFSAVSLVYSLQRALPVSKEIMMLTGWLNESLKRRVSPFLSEDCSLPQISLSYGISSVAAGRKGTFDQHILLWTRQGSSFTCQWNHRRNRIISSANTLPQIYKDRLRKMSDILWDSVQQGNL